MVDRDRIKAQIAVMEKLQDLLLKEYLKRLEAGTISDTGMANLQKLLMNNGWSLDETQLPQSLREKLTKVVDPKDLREDDPDVIALYG